MPLFSAGHNDPGYLPDSPPTITRDWQVSADLRSAAEELQALQPSTAWQATVGRRAWWLDDLGDQCPECGYPLAEGGWPQSHHRPGDGRACLLRLDDGTAMP